MLHSLNELRKKDWDFDSDSKHFKIKRKDESGELETFVVQVHFQKLFFERQKCITITLNDITQMEKNVALQAKNKVLNTMQSSISHEMLTPLKCISSIAELMKQEHEYDKQLTENLETIESSVQFVLSQIKQKLDYALID